MRLMGTRGGCFDIGLKEESPAELAQTLRASETRCLISAAGCLYIESSTGRDLSLALEFSSSTLVTRIWVNYLMAALTTWGGTSGPQMGGARAVWKILRPMKQIEMTLSKQQFRANQTTASKKDRDFPAYLAGSPASARLSVLPVDRHDPVPHSLSQALDVVQVSKFLERLIPGLDSEAQELGTQVALQLVLLRLLLLLGLRLFRRLILDKLVLELLLAARDRILPLLLGLSYALDGLVLIQLGFEPGLGLPLQLFSLGLHLLLVALQFGQQLLLELRPLSLVFHVLGQNALEHLRVVAQLDAPEVPAGFVNGVDPVELFQKEEILLVKPGRSLVVVLGKRQLDLNLQVQHLLAHVEDLLLVLLQSGQVLEITALGGLSRLPLQVHVGLLRVCRYGHVLQSLGPLESWPDPQLQHYLVGLLGVAAVSACRFYTVRQAFSEKTNRPNASSA